MSPPLNPMNPQIKSNPTQTTTVLESSPITAQKGSLHKTSFTFNNIGNVTTKIKEQWMSIEKKENVLEFKKMRHEKAKNKKRQKNNASFASENGKKTSKNGYSLDT